jgi:hypothetical protein
MVLSDFYQFRNNELCSGGFVMEKCESDLFAVFIFVIIQNNLNYVSAAKSVYLILEKNTFLISV